MKTVHLIGLIMAASAMLARAQGTLSFGSIGYGNLLPGSGIDAPVFDVDCETRLNGRDYLAQVYVGMSSETLEPLGRIFEFGSGTAAGYIPPHSVTIPGVSYGLVYTQLRAWEAAAGPSYEAAVAAGGKYGFSNIVPMEAAIEGIATPRGLQSFCLVPEPPAWALGLVGMAGAWLASRYRLSPKGDPR